MNKKHTIKKTAAMLLGIAIAMGTTGCGFITTDNQKDLEQIVAKVDITPMLKEDASYAPYADSIEGMNLSGTVSKRDLVSYFMSTGYQYVQSYGYTYEATFNMLLDGLISREIMIQYAVAYFLKNGGTEITKEGCEAYIDAELAKVSGKERENLENHKELLTFKYFLTENGTDLEDYERTVYSLKKSLNDSLDSMEESYITAESEEHEHEEARTLPTGVDTEKEDYYTNDYDVYTGRNAADSCGEYEKVDGSTVTSRQKAYNLFLTNLQSYNLIGKGENTSKLTQLDYFYVELSSQLAQALVNKYYEALETEISNKLVEDYMREKYQSIYEQNEQDYAEDPSAFSTALDGASADSFILYGLEDFGFVYNILIPFSTSQNVKYTEAKNRGLTEAQLYAARRDILDEIKGKDLRDTWISTDEHVNYSYKKGEEYYFFEDQLTENTKYEKLSQYAGNYPFNGTVTEVDGEYEIVAKEIDIDDFIGIMESYITETSGATASGSPVSTYYNDSALPFKEKGEINYDKFTYYTGSVAFTETQTAAGFFDPSTQQYKALSAVNELLFAYGTDPGALNSYMGYSVSPYGTNFVKEFEYAAQEVVKAGVGNYAVCATDYGWHILYCSFKYEGGEVYGGYVHEDKDKEGTFSNLFYEYIKESAYTNHATEIQNRVLIEYDNGSCVTRYQKAYQDLLDMDA